MPVPSRHHWLTWANLLTASRAALIAPFAWLVLSAQWPAAAAVFAVAALSDFYDGRLARRLNQTSPLGGLLDHGTDALFVTTGCWSFATLGVINPYLHWLIPLAFTQYMLDSRALRGQSLRTSAIGRSNGVAYFVVVGVGLGAHLLTWRWLLAPLQLLAWLLVFSTLVSMADRAITLLRGRP